MSKTSNSPNIYFIRIRKPQEKLSHLCRIAQQAFEAKKKVLLFAPNETAAEYVDNLLWKFPETSFLPHVIANAKSNERVVISYKPLNVNDAEVLINVNATPHPLWKEFSEVHELFDYTDPQKQTQAQARQRHYESQGCAINWV